MRDARHHWQGPCKDDERAPVSIKPALREAVADLYNHTYRQGKASQYTFENVCIVPGGRSGLSRVAAVIGDVYTVGILPSIFSILQDRG